MTTLTRLGLYICHLQHSGRLLGGQNTSMSGQWRDCEPVVLFSLGLLLNVGNSVPREPRGTNKERTFRRLLLQKNTEMNQIVVMTTCTYSSCLN